MQNIAPSRATLTCRQWGTYLKNPSDTACTQCEIGKYSTSSGKSSCDLCPPGKFQPSVGQINCEDCGVGKYTAYASASACETCPEKQTTYNLHTMFVEHGMSSCTQCPNGKYLNDIEKNCISCSSPGISFCRDGIQKNCSKPTLGQEYISRPCTNENDAILTPCSSCALKKYTSAACTITSDTVCEECAQCSKEIFAEYEYSECTTWNNTRCSPCNSSAGDMIVGLGKCNLCPAGSVFIASSASCTLCGAGTFSAHKDAKSCANCPDGFTSGVGASQCFKKCPPGYYHYYSQSTLACVQAGEGLHTVVAAYDAAHPSISAAAETAVSYHYFIIATRRPSAYSSEILLVHKEGMSWPIAGNGYYSRNVSDGKGTAASFALITSISLSSSTFYLLTEYDPAQNRGYLRRLSLQVSTSSDKNIISAEGEARLLTYESDVSHKIQWRQPTQTVYNAQEERFIVMDTEQSMIALIKLSGHRITECIPFMTSGKMMMDYLVSFNPLSLSLLDRDEMIILDNNKVIGLKALSTSYVQRRVVCGGGWRALPLERESALPCNQVDLSKSGARQVIIPPSQTTIYVLLTSLSDTISAVAQFPTTHSESNTLSILWILSEENSDNIPLLLISSSLQAKMYLVESRGVIKRLGGGDGSDCFCDEGFYCNDEKQCIKPPIGTYTDNFWASPSDVRICPLGTIGTVEGGCVQCPIGFTPNNHHLPPIFNVNQSSEQLSLSLPWYCEASCEQGSFFDESSQTCLRGCSEALGLYYDDLQGKCMPCWLGSESSGGQGIESCIPCRPGKYGKSPGICETCPDSTTTWSQGSTLCMPSSESLLSIREKACADGVFAELPSTSACPPLFETPMDITSLFQNYSHTRVSLAGSMDGYLFVVMTENNQAAIFIYNTIQMPYDWWKINIQSDINHKSFSLLQICEGCHLLNNDYESVERQRVLFHAAQFGTCIYKTNSLQGSTEVFKGDCALQGQPENGLLPVIHSMTLMEDEQISPILYISTLAMHCAEVLSISTYDGSISYFASQDVLKSPTSLLTVCILSPIVLASTKRGSLYAAIEDKIFTTQVSGATALPARFLKTDPIVQIGGIDSARKVTSMAIVTQEGGTKHHLVAVTQNGNIHSIPASAYTLRNQITTMIRGDESAATIITSMALLGRRVFYLNNTDGMIYQILLSNLNQCISGFVIPDSDKSIQGVCLQVGRGFYTDFDNTFQSCARGTFGTKSGASIRHCQPCPDGTIAPFSGAAYCQHCPPGSFSNPFKTECVASCPIGTYQGVNNQCSACQAGFSTQQTGASCTPCEAGTFSDASTSWRCTRCPLGYTSTQGAHNCIKICDEDTCGLDGDHCISLTKQYRVLSQIFTPNGGERIVGLAVDKKGGVFYTNGNSIQYYFDDCPSYLDVCNKVGRDLLQAGKYSSYGFSSLAICNTVYPSPPTAICPQVDESNPKIYFTRKLYVASLTFNSIFVLQICQDIYGTVSLESTIAGAGLSLLAGGNWAGFADGRFTSALFNYPGDLEINEGCSLLYLSDFYNHRIRLLNLTSGTVTTVAGSGNPCWKMGEGVCPPELAQQSCSSSSNTCGSINYPVGIGLSADEKDLFIAANNINALIKLTNAKKGTLGYSCRFSFGNKQSGNQQNCNLNAPNSKGCMLFRAFDVVAVTDYEVYVGVSQGITKIYSEDGGQTFLCEQIAGNYFDLFTAGLVDGISTTSAMTTDTNAPNSLVNIPLKMAFAKDRGVLYFADFNNGAVRRIMVKTNCICPVGSILVPHAASCYNPSPTWSKRPLPVCRQGYYALEGDITCFRKCDEALRLGLSSAPCLIKPNDPQFSTLSYTQLLGDLSPPQSTLQADWYGSVPNALTFTYDWNSIFDPRSTVTYRQGRIPGRAPMGRKFITLTYSTARKCWSEETKFALQPTQILPGLWFPCKTSVIRGTKTCSCPARVNNFKDLPLTQADKDAQENAPKRWQALRLSAALFNASYLGPQIDSNSMHKKDDICPPEKILSENCGNSIQSRSMFMIFGSPDQTSPEECPETAADGGPCFPSLMRHIRRQATPSTAMPVSDYVVQDNRIQSCYMGWPAHYFCPNGYAWIAPSPLPQTCTPISEHATCLSCQPGTYSYLALDEKQKTGGPYVCPKCQHGTYASAPGSSVCLNCPSGKYASSNGATYCDSCPNATYTIVPRAYSSVQCVNCLPGTGNCVECVEGTYQNNGGEIKCLLTPPGFFTARPNASEPTPCPPGFYQDEFGQTSCMQCPISTYTHGYGNTGCEVCAAANCSMAMDNTCGKGCGLNRYWGGAVEGCLLCPIGKINAYDTCATDAEACWQNPRRDYYVSSLTKEVTACPPGSEANSLFSYCILCDEGSYSDTASQGCQACQQGRYSTTTNASTCTLCEAGKTNAQKGSTLCTKCPPGTFLGTPGASACMACPAGQYSDTLGSTACKLCNYGTFNTEESMTECNGTCDDATGYYSLPGDTACKYCDGGVINVSHLCQGCGLGQYLATDEDRACVHCPTGLVNLYNTSATNSSVCTPCASPTAYAASSIACVESTLGYVPNDSNNGQQPCPRGKFRNASQTVCTPCPEGTYSEREATEACSYCEPGTYASTLGQALCASCRDGKIAREPGSSTCQSCPPGSYAVSGTNCTLCPENTFSDGSSLRCATCSPITYSHQGSVNCTFCPTGKALTEKKKCELCPPGKYMIIDTRYNDIPQPIFICQVCGTGKYMPFQSDGSSKCSPCANGTVALRTGLSACTACPKGEYATSALTCGKCPKGTYNVDGSLVCTECPMGTFASAEGKTVCSMCPPGTFQDNINATVCLQCLPGTFSNASGKTACPSCHERPNTFTPLPGQSTCVPKITLCDKGYYINHSESATQDHTCEQCLPCGPNQLTFIPSRVDNRLLYNYTDLSQYTNELCRGDTQAPMYHCIDNTPRAGEFFSLDLNVGEASQSGSFQFKQCQNVKYNSNKVTWVTGGDVTKCYVSCLYGVSSSGLFSYTLSSSMLYGLEVVWEDAPNNIFLERMLDRINEVCLDCPLASSCPRGKYRPRGKINTDCGPECGLPPFCNEGSGCIENCTNAPENADYVGGSPALGDAGACPWICNPGWHLSENKTTCIPCPNAEEAAQVCGSTDYVLIAKEQCLYWHTSDELCKACPRIANGRSIGWDSTTKQCKYQCYRGYFMGENLTCLSCTVIEEGNCPVGMYLDREGCALYGEPPICKPCAAANQAVTFTTNGGLNASKCRGICPQGFHTVSQITGEYASSYAQLPYALEAQCIQCAPEDQRSCLRNNASTCFEGYFRNLTIGENQAGSCAPCRTQSQCKPHHYITPCKGDGVVDAPCIPCPDTLLKDSSQQYVTKKFISYSDLATLDGQALLQVISRDYCPRVCLNNFARDPAQPNQCITCKSMGFDLQRKLDPTKISDSQECIVMGEGAPPACAFTFSIWNATPAVPWWDAVKGTPWLNVRPLVAGEPAVHRAGICWPCPNGMVTGVNDRDLCSIIPGFISPSQDLPVAKEAIPSLPADISVIWQNPPVYIPLNKKTTKSGVKRRHLLSLNLTTIGSSNSTTKLLLLPLQKDANPCPYGYYKPSAGEGKCFECPLGSSTRAVGSVSKEACMCKYGHYKVTENKSYAFCLPCPAETFGNMSMSIMASPVNTTLLQQQKCFPCPPNHTTYGTMGATRCVCALGMIKDDVSGVCEICPSGYYCKPCGGSNCSLAMDGISKNLCFAGSSSPEGSYEIQNCTCKPGAIKKSRAKRPSEFYCQNIPMGGEVDAVSGNIVCQPGWTTVSRAEDGSVTECSLCTPGKYAQTISDQNQNLMLDSMRRPVCEACPKGFFISSKFGIGETSCISCPAQQTTSMQGSTSLDDCVCPSSMAKVNGMCKGCAQTQFVDPKNTSKCVDCPANAVAQTGATSVNHCMCNPGFYINPQKICTLCPRGKYSQPQASYITACMGCPVGSTTSGEGKSGKGACSVCERGYEIRGNLGCVKSSSIFNY